MAVDRPSGLTASCFEAAIRYYYDPDAPSLYRGTAAEVILIREGLLYNNKLTERGLVFVHHILETPLPTQSWTVVRNPAAEHGFPA